MNKYLKDYIAKVRLGEVKKSELRQEENKDREIWHKIVKAVISHNGL